jgi:hypothetical protein
VGSMAEGAGVRQPPRPEPVESEFGTVGGPTRGETGGW